MENLVAEQYFLACILKDPSLIKETKLEGDQLSEFQHQVLFKTMHEIDKLGEVIDYVSIYTKLGNSGLFQIGGSNILSHLSQLSPTTDNFKQYEKYIIEAWQITEAKEKVNHFINESNDLSSNQKLTDLLNELSKIEEAGHQEKKFNLKETLLEMTEEAHQERGTILGLDTGYTELNQMTDGNQKGDLIIVAARPSVGKTAYALNIATNHCKGDAVGHIYSLEMDKKKLLNRMISSIGNIDSMKLRNPTRYFNENDWGRYAYAVGIIEKMNVFIYDEPLQTVPEIYATSRELIRKYPNKDHFIIIDYMGLIKPVKKLGTRNEEVSEISRSLKIMARGLNCPVICLSQLSRGVEQRQDKRPMLSDLRESGSIEQDADRVEFLYRDDYYDKETEKKDIIEIIIAKQRNGPVGTVELAFIKEYNKFVNLERRFNDR